MILLWVYETSSGRRVNISESSLVVMGTVTVPYSLQCIKMPFQYREKIFPLPDVNGAEFLSDPTHAGPGSSTMIKYKRK